MKIVSFFVIGKLILSVDKDTYEELGLQGRPSQYSGKKAMRYSKYNLLLTLLISDWSVKHLVRMLNQ